MRTGERALVTRQSEDRRAAVLAALHGAPRGVSGEMLADALGVSRVAIRKHVAALLDLGYVIEARPGEGYRLVEVPDAPLPFEIGPLLKTGFYTRLEGGQATGSTNDDARAMALAGAPEGAVVLASEQRTGRGRLGREWASPPGGAYASIVLRPTVETPDAMVLPLVVGLGAARGLEALGADVRLKWPNDVLVPDGRKLAGVLLEGLSEGWRVAWIVAGIGLNVRCAPRDHHSACLDDVVTGHPTIAAVVASVLDCVAEAYGTWRRDGFESLRAEYEALSWLTGRGIRVTDAAGRLVADGTGAGIDKYGRLVVATPDGPVSVAAGDVTLHGGVEGYSK
jgi:BirA family transcriptional regulator, biotin operon repressor / biotin---[acetyl-CoA-carboxylase] ligase